MGVATIAAMKSGLKVVNLIGDSVYDRSSNHCRDESGLKDEYPKIEYKRVKGSNHCRDEKRTERAVLGLLEILVNSSNHCRDEKRTERHHARRMGRFS